MRKIANSVVEWILSTSVFMAMCAVALCVATEKMMMGHIPALLSPLHALIAGSTLLEYNVHHIFNAHSSVSWSANARRWHWIMIILGSALCIVALPWLDMQVLIACGALGVLAFAYSTPLLPFRYKRRLKDYGIIKISVLTVTWVVATTVLPALYWKLPFEYLWLEIACRLLLIFPLCLSFDIRDVENDMEAGIDTVPSSIGTHTTYRLINISLLLLVIEGLLQYFRRGEVMHVIAIVVSAGATWLAISYSKKRPHPFVFLGLVDGVMLLYGVLTLF